MSSLGLKVLLEHMLSVQLGILVLARVKGFLVVLGSFIFILLRGASLDKCLVLLLESRHINGTQLELDIGI